MPRVFLAMLFTGLLSVGGWAQDAQEPPDEGQTGVGEAAPPESPPSGREAGRMRMRWAFQHILDELGLDEQQRRKFEEITAKHEGRMLDLEERWREIREAQRAGDRELANRLRAEMRDRRGPDAGMDDILEELEPSLREDQIAKLWDLQDQMQERRSNRERYQWLMSELPAELNLDAGQKVHYQKILDAQRNKMQERIIELRPLMDQLRRAEAAGDDERVRQLREQLEESTPKREEMIEWFLAELPEILREDQVELLAQSLAEHGAAQAAEKEASAELDVRLVLRAARRARLEENQRGRIREIEREAIAAYRRIPGRDKDAQSRLAAEVKGKIEALLNEQQKAAFETALQRLERGGRFINRP